MNKVVNFVSNCLVTIAVFAFFAIVAFIGALYAILSQWIPFLPISTVINFDQFITAILIGTIVGLIAVAIYHSLRKH